MKLIVGLGNPGAKYKKSRHNLGFLALEKLANELAVKKWKTNTKLDSLLIKVPNLDVLLVKPATFVNNSGEAVKKLVDFYKIKPKEILVIRDDIDLPAGKIRGPKTQTGSGGHLGVESIIENLKTRSFYQLKIGISRPPANFDPADFVLQKTADKQWENFKNLIEKEVVAKVQNWIDG